MTQKKDGTPDIRDLLGTGSASTSEQAQPVFQSLSAAITEHKQKVDAEVNERVLNPGRKWATMGDTYLPDRETKAVERVPNAVYKPGHSMDIGFYLTRVPVTTDELIAMPDEATSEIIGEFETFWAAAPQFRKRGFLHKRGFLLWGPPGSGKTSLLNQLMNRVVNELDGVVILGEGSPTLIAGGLGLLRKMEPHRPAIVVMEDIDATVRRYGESELLSLLDGESQVDNVVFVATTNYPELLDKRLVDRPSRFDRIRYVGMPGAKAREAYLRAKEPELAEEELREWVAKTKGFSVAHLRELIIAVKCLGNTLDESIERLEGMRNNLPTSDEAGGKSIGFGARAAA